MTAPKTGVDAGESIHDGAGRHLTGVHAPVEYHHYGPLLIAEVIDTPVTQGSIKSLGKGRPSIHANAKTLKPWREHLIGEFREQMQARPPWRDHWPLEGPVAVDVTFTVRKPASAPKRRRTWPAKKPDLDKLLRAVLDALTIAGAIGDDAQVVESSARKVFPREHPQASDAPGALIYLYRVGEPR